MGSQPLPLKVRRKGKEVPWPGAPESSAAPRPSSHKKRKSKVKGGRLQKPLTRFTFFDYTFGEDWGIPVVADFC
jgi:hypothetical protein